MSSVVAITTVRMSNVDILIVPCKAFSRSHRSSGAVYFVLIIAKVSTSFMSALHYYNKKTPKKLLFKTPKPCVASRETSRQGAMVPVVQVSMVPVVQVSMVPVVLVSMVPVVQVSMVPVMLVSMVPVMQVSMVPVMQVSMVPVMLVSMVPVMQVSMVPVVQVSMVPVVQVSMVPVVQVSFTSTHEKWEKKNVDICVANRRIKTKVFSRYMSSNLCVLCN